MIPRLPETLGGTAVRDHLLRAPWCRPADPHGAIEALTGVPAPPAPPPGHTVGVTVGGAAVFELGPDLDEVPLAADARAQEQVAARVAAREVGVEDPRWVDHRQRLGARLLDARDYAFAPIEGPSFGLAFFLGHVSLLVGEPVPPDLAATGALASDGAVLPVDGVPAKLALLEEIAVGVRRVLVPAGAAPSGSGLAVVPVRHVREALAVAFPDLEERLRRRWLANPGEAALAARRLYRLATCGELREWEGVHRRAGWLAAALPAGSPARRQVELAADVALRHTQVDGPAPEWPEALIAAERIRPFRLRLVAHLVQAAADHDDASALRFAERASALVRPLEERSAEDAILLGAIGRALASAGELPSAADVLEDALETWDALEAGPEASRALCERLRLAGLLGERAALDRLERVAAAVRAHPATDGATDAYVRLALARARVDAGEPARALALLEGGRWDEAPRHVLAARERCRLQALRAVGRPAAAEILDEPWGTLAALDAALAEGRETEALLARLAADPLAGREVRRLLARCPAGEAPAAFVARRFRY